MIWISYSIDSEGICVSRHLASCVCYLRALAPKEKQSPTLQAEAIEPARRQIPHILSQIFSSQGTRIITFPYSSYFFPILHVIRCLSRGLSQKTQYPDPDKFLKPRYPPIDDPSRIQMKKSRTFPYHPQPIPNLTSSNTHRNTIP